jgi:agmatinase
MSSNNKAQKILDFNPNDPAASEQLFGLPFSREEAEMVILPLPWEVTVSYHAGTAGAPHRVLEASAQVDLYDPVVKDAWHTGFYLEPVSDEWENMSRELRTKAVLWIDALTSEEGPSEKDRRLLDTVNDGCKLFHDQVKQKALSILNEGKLLVGLGGDHSTPYGIIAALAEKHDSFGVLQLDAHADLRNAYEGFQWSHASIMYNVIQMPQVSVLVQAGIRDYCEEEMLIIQDRNSKVKTWFDRDIKNAQYRGKSFSDIADEIIQALPQKVFLSFDIDALDPKLCPHTGTPVAGGFEATEVLFLLEKLVESGRTLIGFDLNETGNHEWDANVSSRLLYRMLNLLALSNGRAQRH